MPEIGSTSARPAILLASSNLFDLLDPAASVFTIADIVRGLWNICRFGGQSRQHYSVAQHSVFVSQIVPPADAYAGLMHDAAEAFISDVLKPLKRLLPDYRRLEARVESVVFARFRVPQPLPASVQDADLVMLATEQRALMPHRLGRPYAGGRQPLNLDIPALAPEQAMALFLDRFAELADVPRGSVTGRS